MADARATNSGMITFGMVSVPVQMYPMATDRAVRFNNVHAPCGSRTKSPTHCPACDKDVTPDEITKGFTVGTEKNGTLVLLSDDDMAALPLRSNKAIEIEGFVEAEDLDWYRLDASYFVGPDMRQNVGHKPFHLLHAALESSGKVAIGRMARASKEVLVAIRPFGRVLAMSYLRWNDDLNAVAGVEETLETDAQLSPQELQLAQMLVDSMPDALGTVVTARDGFRAAVMEVVNAKLEGREVEAPPAPAPESKVVDLAEALRQSILDARAAKGGPSTGEELAAAATARSRKAS